MSTLLRPTFNEITCKNEVHACREEQYYVLYDRPVTVELLSVPEE